MHKKTIFFLIITFCIHGLSFARAIRTEKPAFNIVAAIGSRADISDLIKAKRLLPPYGYFLGAEYRSKGIYSGPMMLNIGIMKHFGKQDSLELILYPSIEFKPLYIGNLGIILGIGDGISFMAGPYPKFEETKTIKTQRLLNFFMIESSFFFKDNIDTKFIIRWHHRCNLARNIGPKGAGANFISLGLRKNL